jgi:hypothetical protein
MNENRKRVPTAFAPEPRFWVTPVPAVPLRGRLETELERLKSRLLARALRDTPYPEFDALICRAASEAAGLAWLTAYPLLVFPALFDEQVQVAVQQGLHQAHVHQRSLELLAQVV